MGQKRVHGILTGQTTGRAQPLVQLDRQTFRGLAISCNVFSGSPSTLEALRSISAILLHARGKISLLSRQRLVGVGLSHQVQEGGHLFKRMPLPDCPWRNLHESRNKVSPNGTNLHWTSFSFAVTL